MDKLFSVAHSALGNVISTLGIIIALVAGWNDMISAIATNAAQIQSQQHLIEQTAAELRQLRHEVKADLKHITELIHNHERRSAAIRQKCQHNRGQWERQNGDSRHFSLDLGNHYERS